MKIQKKKNFFWGGLGLGVGGEVGLGGGGVRVDVNDEELKFL